MHWLVEYMYVGWAASGSMSQMAKLVLPLKRRSGTLVLPTPQDIPMYHKYTHHFSFPLLSKFFLCLVLVTILFYFSSAPYRRMADSESVVMKVIKVSASSCIHSSARASFYHGS